MEKRTCRTALNRSKIPGAEWCVNPYVGCTHGCAYCYATFMERFAPVPESPESRRPWGTYAEAKSNIADVLEHELRRPKSGRVMLSSVTDAYQPVESVARLTRACLSLLADSGLSVSILTKSDLVVRDIDILKSFGGLLGDARATVGFTITTLDDDIARIIEPGATPPSRRLEALRTISAAGIATWVFIAPVIPGIADHPEIIASISDTATRYGAGHVHIDPLNFYPSAVDGLMNALTPSRPDIAAAISRAAGNPAAWKAGIRGV